MLDAFVLSRIQFAANISFHILFPAITIALAWFLLFFKIRFDLTNNPIWMRAYRFWVKIFALTFALGVVSGVTMSFQFGSNWPGFMETVGNIAGPLLGYEVLTAFFLEATFLGVMLFGINKVPSKIHTLATFLVAFGTTLSAFWIISLNSWMHTPQGFEMRDGVAFPVDWLAIIFNPSFPYRLTHVLLASGITAAFMIAGISAYRILKQDPKRAPRLTLKVSLIVAAILLPLQIFVGDMHGLNTLQHQPEKIAAIEAVWHTEKGAPLVLFALPNKATQTNDFAIEIPNLASFILTHDFQGEIQGLSSFEHHPPVAPLFWGFRVMVGLGFLMLAMAFLGNYYIVYKKQFPSLLLKGFVLMTFVGWIATLSGWYVTEIGRQPWLVNGVLTTEQAVTSLAPGNIIFSLSLYLVTYVFLLVAYIHTVFTMAKKSVTVAEFETRTLDPAYSVSTDTENQVSPLQHKEA